MPDDDGSLVVFEALLAAVFLFGAVLFLVETPLPGENLEPASVAGEAMAGDVLRILSVRPGDDGHLTKLEEFVAEALLGDASDAQAYFERTLPVGAGWAFTFDNGVETRTLAESGQASGAAVAEDVMLYPDWDHVLLIAAQKAHHGTSAADTLVVHVVPRRNSFLDADSTGSVRFSNDHEVGFTRRADGVGVTAAAAPELPGSAGYDTPYTLTDATAFADSVNAHDPLGPFSFKATTTLLDPVVDDVLYRVQPDHLVDSDLQAFVAAGGHVTTDAPSYHPGEAATISYDHAAAPMPAGWVVTGREIRIRGPLEGETVASAAVADATDAWTWTIPADALYGTYVVELRTTFAGTHPQVVTEVALFDVLRPGTTTPAPPVYRVGLAVWFNALS